MFHDMGLILEHISKSDRFEVDGANADAGNPAVHASGIAS